MEKYMIIDGERVSFTDEKNILSVIRKAGIILPTFCYYSDLSIYGACRMCVVEDKWGGIVASCSTPPKHEMEIYTNTPQLYYHRKRILELLLAAHCRDCTTCEKNGKCKLQELAKRFGIPGLRFENTNPIRPIDRSSKAIVKDPNKCILCGDCVRACEELQGIGALNFAYRGTEAIVIPAFNKKIAETQCVNCGQCRVYCPTGAISIKTHMDEVWEALADPDVRVVAQIAPAVRVAVGDHYSLPKGRSVMGKIVNALHRMGFDEIYDTTFSADLTIMEETAEFLKRVEKGEKLPLLTSCCPAWVKFITDQYKDYIPNLSTCRSPQGMMSAVIKEYFRDPENAKGKKTVMVSIMPCTAKKAEAIRPNSFTDEKQDTDIVITTTELLRMIDNFGLDFAQLEPEACDMPFGFGSGGGVIFGVTGGVTEAVLRRLSPDHSKETMREISECGVRGDEGIKEFTVPYKGMDINVCVASGLANARTVMERVKNGEANYHLIEVMACRRGCIMGGGQPVRAGDRTKAARAKGLYNADNTMLIKKSDENPMVLELYQGLLKGKEHKLLHNDFY
mgnify:CR=1 FL=1